MWNPETSPVGARDRGLEALRSWTTFIVVLAAGLTAVFAFLAAGTFPGRTANAAGATSQSSSSTGDQPSYTQPSDDQGSVQPQAPSQGFFGGGGGGGGGGFARSGGS